MVILPYLQATDSRIPGGTTSRGCRVPYVKHVKWHNVCISPLFAYGLQAGCAPTFLHSVQCSTCGKFKLSFWRFLWFFKNSFDPWLVESGGGKMQVWKTGCIGRECLLQWGAQPQSGIRIAEIVLKYRFLEINPELPSLTLSSKRTPSSLSCQHSISGLGQVHTITA